MIKQLLVAAFVMLAVTAQADVKLPKLVSDGMVLQRDVPLKIWGWAEPGEHVEVEFIKGRMYNAVTNARGEWSIQLPAMVPGGPYDMKIRGKNTLLIRNILVGDVWLCSGQSNMELPMERVKYKYADVIAKSDYPLIRQFLVPDKYDFKEPRNDVEAGSWIIASGASNINTFSAVGFFFAKEIFEQLHIPIGIINAALGGSPAEAWISENSLRAFPAYYQEAIKFRNDRLIAEIESNDSRVQRAWYDELNDKDQGFVANWKQPLTSYSGWDTISVPGYWNASKLGAVNGVVWYRRKFEVKAGMANNDALLELGRVVDGDSVFINGKFVGTTSYQYPPRRYELPKGTLQSGENELVVRVVNTSGRGGFVPDKLYEIRSAKGKVPLSGTWHYRMGATVSPLPAQTFIRWKPMGLFNAMIAPLNNYAIKGVLWYQGESNTSHPEDYGELMTALIKDWRSHWQSNDMPFLYVQLANFMEALPQPHESNWAALRQQQLNLLELTNTGMAVTIDAGEWNDIHPENKEIVGHRLALLARSKVYGDKSLVVNGPLCESVKLERNRMVLQFSNTGRGLVTSDKKDPGHFAIAGADKKYVWAKARIEGNKVVVWNEEVSNPVSVRYAWADNPKGANLCNKEGLPASPFEMSSQ